MEFGHRLAVVEKAAKTSIFVGSFLPPCRMSKSPERTVTRR